MSDRHEEMLARRAEVIAAHPEVTMAFELALLMGDLESEYWRWKLDEYLAGELGGVNGED